MDKETLFTASKWDILQALSTGKKSPQELARASNTSVANISQQLRMLELAGIITSERLPNREKGQPRLLFSLAGDFSFLIATTPYFVDKRLIALEARQKATLRIWFYDNPEIQYYLEKAFWEISESLPDIDALVLDKKVTGSISLHIYTGKEAAVKKTAKPLTIKHEGITRSVTFTIRKTADLAKLTKHHYIIYDPLHHAAKAASDG